MPDSPYAPASHIPLIKSPSLRVPRPVELPPDIHPLPDSVTDYFVYPFTLEPHVLTLESSRRATLAAHAARRAAYLQTRENDKERRKRDVLRKIAPGFEPQGTVLVPTRASMNIPVEGNAGSGESGHRHTDSIMQDLVDQLAALDSGSNSPRR